MANHEPDPTSVKAHVRAFCEKADRKEDAKPRPSRDVPELPYLALVFDTETLADDPSQRLTFASYAILARSSDGASYDPIAVESGFFYADSESVPREFSVRLNECVTAAAGDVPGVVLSQTEFLERFYDLAVVKGALVVGYNLPFDLTRIVRDATEARKSAKGGFSLIPWANETKTPSKRGYIDKGRYGRPRIIVKSLGPRKASIRFSNTGHFSDGEEKLRIALETVDRIERRRRVPLWMTDGSPVKLYREWARRLHAAPKSDRAALGQKLVAEFTAERFKFTNQGRFLDVSTLVSALTDRSYSLGKACEAFGVKPKGSTSDHPGWAITSEYVRYNWNDVESTCELLDAALRAFAKHPIDLAPDKAFSTASIGKAYFRAFGITPLLKRWPDFPRDVLGKVAATFFGGSTGVALRRCIAPVKYVDFLSMYSTVNTLLRTDDLLRAADYRIIDCTTEANEILATMEADAPFDPDFWKRISFFGRVVLDGTGVFPIRTVFEAGDAPRIGMCYARSNEPQWYAGPDIVASFALTGERPQVAEAFRIEPARNEAGKIIVLESMQSLDLLGAVSVDPSRENIFKRIIEERVIAKKKTEVGEAERERLDKGLKCLASATGFGVFAEVNVDDTGDLTEMTVYSGSETFVALNENEAPGPFSFLPIASLITAGAHLMLALLEREVARRGGTIVAWDTDSSAIVSTRDGGPVHMIAADEERSRRTVHALSWAEVWEIIERFESLNPYDRTVVRESILKMEDVNFVDCDPSKPLRDVMMFAVSSKRYCMFEIVDSEPRFLSDEKGKIGGVKESALGALVGPVFDGPIDERTNEPIDAAQAEAAKSVWIPRFWEVITRRAMDLPEKDTSWLRQHLVANFKLSAASVWKQFETMNRGLSYDERPKPHGFGITPRFETLGSKAPRMFGARVKRSEMFGRDRVASPFFYSATGERVSPNIDESEWPYCGHLVSTFGDLANTYPDHPESKMALPTGEPCNVSQYDYAGPLFRRHVKVDGRVVVGKESAIFDDEIAQATGAAVDDIIAAALSPMESHGLRIVDLLPIRETFGSDRKSGRIAQLLRDERAGRNAKTASIEAKMLRSAARPGALDEMVRRLVRKRGPEADAAAVALRKTWQRVIAEHGGIIADEVPDGVRYRKAPEFAAVPPRYRSKDRPPRKSGVPRRFGNVATIVAALGLAGIETDAAGVLSWCAADRAPAPADRERLAIDCEAEVRTWLRARGITPIPATKTACVTRGRELRKFAKVKRERRELLGSIGAPSLLMTDGDRRTEKSWKSDAIRRDMF